MLAFPATTLWGRKINKQARAVWGMLSALKEADSAVWDHRGGAANFASQR